MGGSTVTLQSVVDNVRTIGDIAPVFPIGGQVTKAAVSIGNAVLKDMLSPRFNWKWNRAKIPPFCVNPYQQDYALSGVSNVAWLEHGIAMQINSTQMPKPITWLEAVRDLEMTSYQFGMPRQVCWLPNNQLNLGGWPGAGLAYTWPIGPSIVSTPNNPPLCWIDTNGNVLTLTNQASYGTTSQAAVAAPANSVPGFTVADNTCTWTVCDPNGQGIRVSPLPPLQGVVWQVYLFAQQKLAKLTTISSLINPIPDDFSNYFEDGFIAYSYQRSADPRIRGQFETKHTAWLGSLQQAVGQSDRERDSAGFVPDTTVVQGYGGMAPVGPAWPFPPLSN